MHSIDCDSICSLVYCGSEASKMYTMNCPFEILDVSIISDKAVHALVDLSRGNLLLWPTHLTKCYMDTHTRTVYTCVADKDCNCRVSDVFDQHRSATVLSNNVARFAYSIGNSFSKTLRRVEPASFIHGFN